MEVIKGFDCPVLDSPLFEVLLCISSVPSDIQNVTVVNNGTHILASWTEPEFPNGVLRYNITLTDTDLLTGETSDIAKGEVVSETEFGLQFIVDFYIRYEIIVVPFTGAGAGNEGTDAFDTDQGSKYVICVCKILLTYFHTKCFLMFISH